MVTEGETLKEDRGRYGQEVSKGWRKVVGEGRQMRRYLDELCMNKTMTQLDEKKDLMQPTHTLC